MRKLVLVSAAGISAENMWREPVMAVGRLMAVGAARTGVKSLPVVNRPRLRRAALQLVVRYPERISVPLASELVRGAGTKGFVGGLDAVLAYSFREHLPGIEVPTMIVWGRNDTLIPVEDAYEFQRLIGVERPRRGLRRHGPSGDARAADALQRAARCVHRGGDGARGRYLRRPPLTPRGTRHPSPRRATPPRHPAPPRLATRGLAQLGPPDLARFGIPLPRER